MAFLDEIGLAELWNIIQATNARVVVGSYTGTGTYGSANPNTLTFEFEPKALLIASGDMGANSGGTAAANPLFLKGRTQYSLRTNAYSSGGYYSAVITPIYVTFEGNTISWYGDPDANYTAADGVDYQFNASGVVYNYIAIG